MDDSDTLNGWNRSGIRLEIEHARVRRDFLAFDMEVMRRKTDTVIAMRVHVLNLLGQLAQHLLIEIRAACGHALPDFIEAADRR